MLGLTDYESVIAIAEEAHFRRAARRLEVTQPALSARLRRIEEHLGVRLFDRERGGVRLTPAGEQFVEGAARVISAAKEAAQSARNAHIGLGQTLRIGMTQVAARQLVIPALSEFCRRHPQARLRLFESTTAALERHLELARIDAAFLHPPLHAPGLSEAHIVTAPLFRFSPGPKSATGRPIVRYPRAEAPVLMTQLGRLDDEYGASFAPAEADTMLGAFVLSRAGFGDVIAPEAFPGLFGLGMDGVAGAPTGLTLETSFAWRSLDRRPLIRQLAEIAVEVSSPGVPAGASLPV
ncbi:MAG: LysR family transcriptional regulator [Roseibium sp.]|nr:LysR family transcriptional regulator [Roseibium sp.]